jgi:O-antigen/teichoic acid export membrane protein
MTVRDPVRDAAHDPDAGPRPGLSARSVVMTYGTNVAVSALSLANVVVVSRVLGPSARGEVAFLTTVATVTGQIACLSVQEANANLGASRARSRASLATNSLILSFALGAVAAAVVLGLVALVPAVGGPVPAGLLVIALAVVPAVIAKNYLSFLLQAEYAFGSTNAAWLSGPLLSATGNAVLAVAGVLTVTNAFVVWALAQVAGVLLLVVRIQRGAGLGRPDRRLARETIHFGLKVHPGRLMGVSNYRADQWIVGAISGSQQLGWYNVAASWADLLYYVPGVLTLVQRPDLVRAKPEEAARRAARVFRAVTVVTVIAAAGLALFAPFLIDVIFGPAFAPAVTMLRILALGAVGIAAIDLLTNALTAQRMPIRGMWAIFATFVITTILDFTLIPSYGGIGASIATSVAYSAGGILAVIIFARSLPIQRRMLAPRADDVRSLRTSVARLVSRGDTAP